MKYTILLILSSLQLHAYQVDQHSYIKMREAIAAQNKEVSACSIPEDFGRIINNIGQYVSDSQACIQDMGKKVFTANVAKSCRKLWSMPLTGALSYEETMTSDSDFDLAIAGIRKDLQTVNEAAKSLKKGESLILSSMGCFEISDDETYTTTLGVRGSGALTQMRLISIKKNK